MSRQQRMGVNLGGVKEAGFRDLLLRFIFGVVVAIAAGLVSLRFGARMGGLFLAFPAILPAGLTLIEQKEGKEAARHDAGGAVIGSAGMLTFAIAAYLLLPALAAPLALALALLVWIAVSVALYLVSRRLVPEGSRKDPS
jgi:uncharacterized membrane protein (GlpM family)